MIKSINKKLVVGLDIGTSKVVVVVGEILKDNIINIIGIGQCTSKGVDKGVINDLKAVMKCIKKSINQAEIMANCKIHSVYLALSTQYICCHNEIGIIPIYDNEVTKEDIQHAIHISQCVRIKNNHNILHIIPKEYSIDNQKGIKNPIGLSGMRLQSNVHLITCHHDIKKNIIKTVEKCGLYINKLIFSGLASSKAVLTQEECELGVCMIDIGSGTMDITIYVNGVIEYSQVIPYAGNIVTSDIAYALSTSHNTAETIKEKYGSETTKIIQYNEEKKIDNPNNILKNTLKKDYLIKIIKLRYIELLKLVNYEIQTVQEYLYYQGIKTKLEGGIVLTGGGTQIECIIDCAKKIFNLPVRIGYPNKINGIEKNHTSAYLSTAVGLLHYGKKYYIKNEKKIKEKKYIINLFKSINNWLKK